MTARETDVVIIGAGTAGMNAVRACRDFGSNWLLIESGPYGTTCAREGCMPSKLLIAAADRARAVSTSRPFGIDVDHWRVDANRLFTRLRQERDRFVKGVIEDIEALPDRNKLRGRASFESRDRIVLRPPEGSDQSETLEIKARAFVVATGAEAFIPHVFEQIRDSLWTSSDVFELDALPPTLAVIGTGAIGLELGLALEALGVEVAFFSNESEIGPFKDPELQDYVRRTLEDNHCFHLDADINSATEAQDGFTLGWNDESGRQRHKTFSKILLATGRRPELSDLALASTGLSLDDDGMPEHWNPVTTQCGESSIFLAGDASGFRPVLHEAADEGRIAGHNASRYPEVEKQLRRTPLSIVFSHPQMAQVGCIDGSNTSCVRVSVSLENQGRARVIGQNKGLISLWFDRSSDQITGAELFGPQIEHLAHLMAWAVQTELTAERMLELPFYHPVLEESLRTALRRAVKALDVEDECQPSVFTECPGA